MSSFTLEEDEIPKPRFGADQIVVELKGKKFVRHQLDKTNSILLIDRALPRKTIPKYVRKSSRIERYSPMCNTPGGKKPIPREQVCYREAGDGKSYVYSGTKHETTEFPDFVKICIAHFIAKINTYIPDNKYVIPDTATDLIYSDKQERGGSIGAHKDDENPNWGMVFIFSLGQTRYLRIRKEGGAYINVKLQHNTLAVMHGKTFQQIYTHQIDKLPATVEVKTRHSLNVRCIVDN